MHANLTFLIDSLHAAFDEACIFKPLAVLLASTKDIVMLEILISYRS